MEEYAASTWSAPEVGEQVRQRRRGDTRCACFGRRREGLEASDYVPQPAQRRRERAPTRMLMNDAERAALMFEQRLLRPAPDVACTCAQEGRTLLGGVYAAHPVWNEEADAAICSTPWTWCPSERHMIADCEHGVRALHRYVRRGSAQAAVAAPPPQKP